jgi:4-hydroxybenzoate polyprenyltransferase
VLSTRGALTLVAASHPLPSAAVTAFAVAVSAAAGRSAGGVLLTGLAVLTGQLSIGWSNDLLDRSRDVAAGRSDKPLATGAADPRTVRRATGVAVLACVPLSLANGLLAGTVHLVAVCGGWAYNLGLKRTWASPVPYAVSFALLTCFVTLGLDGSPWPPPWAVGAGALLGVGAHFLNVVPDVADDLADGVRGLPQRIGARASAVTGAVLMAAAAVLVVAGPDGPVPRWAWVGLGAALATATGAAVAGSRPRARASAPFLLAVATAGVTVLLVIGRGGDLT